MEGHKGFQNKACQYYPCHKIEDEETFNCLFCYCPLYLLKDDCGGHFTYLESGIKSCMGCTKPHDANGYEHVQEKMDLVIERAKKLKKTTQE